MSTSNEKAVGDMTDAELSIAIATEVCGWTDIEKRSFYNGGIDDEPDMVLSGTSPSNPGYFLAVDAASNISTAFSALEAARVKHSVIFQITASSQSWDSTWRINWCNIGLKNDQSETATFEKLPRAICIALLVAIRAAGKQAL